MTPILVIIVITLRLIDGAVLAHYLVSRGVFENPLTREGLSRKDTLRLDAFLESHGEGSGNAVTDAFDLQGLVDGMNKVREGGDSQTNRRLRRDATVALYSLFNFRGVRRGRVEAPRIPSGWHVVDADEPVGPDANEEEGEAFPVFGGGAEAPQAVVAGPAFAEMARKAEEKATEQWRRRDEHRRKQQSKMKLQEEAAASEREREREAYFRYRDDEGREKRRRRAEELEEGRRRQEAASVAWDVACVEDALLQVKLRGEKEAQKGRDREVAEAARVAGEAATVEAAEAARVAEEERRAAHKAKQKEKKKRQAKSKQDDKRIEREAQDKVREVEAKREVERQLKVRAQERCGLCGEGILARQGFSCNELMWCSTKCLREGRERNIRGPDPNLL
jgi:hypothetical protein